MAPDPNRLPRLADGLDLRTLPIGPADAFVLSLVDGSSTEAEISEAAGIEPAALSSTLARLEALGAIRFDSVRPEPARSPRPSIASSGQHTLAIERQSAQAMKRAALLYEEAELEELVDLDRTRKHQILDTYYQLDSLSHYELLGVSPSADKKTIKTRFYEVVNLFHPDRYYGKNLGSFKSKLEKVFQQLTEAQDVLTRSDARAEYDTYLNAHRSTKALERQLHDDQAHALELRDVQERIEREARLLLARASIPSGPALSEPPGRSAASSSSVPDVFSVPSRVGPAAPSTPPHGAERPPTPVTDPDARRRALARKLGMSSPPPAEQRSRPPTPTIAPATHLRAAEDLKRRYDDRMTEARRRQVGEYLTRADAARADGNLVDAVNALRIASSLTPDDNTLRQRLVELELEASRELATRYLDQAMYEEREKRWADAARSYARALAGKPSARLNERVAYCLLQAQTDLKKAVECARNAVLEMPGDASYRVTLARCYLAGKMRESAVGELERAATLAPNDETIKEQIRRLKRGEL